jgi:hypothetical protein
MQSGACSAIHVVEVYYIIDHIIVYHCFETRLLRGLFSMPRPVADRGAGAAFGQIIHSSIVPA